jgi:hypothetical protein
MGTTSRGLGISLFVVVVALLACKGGGDPASCDLREESSTCMDLKAKGTVESTCASLRGKFSKSLCPREGIVGGCKRSEDLTTWYYSGAATSLSDVKSKCTTGTAVNPSGQAI